MYIKLSNPKKMENIKYKILTFLLVLSTMSTFGQTKELVKTFKFGTVSYNLYSQNGEQNSGLVDTTFYLLYRVGNTRRIAKEIKEIKEKSSGDVKLQTTYQIFSKSIIFKRGGFTDDANRKYSQNSNGLLSFEKYGVTTVAPPPPSSGSVKYAVDNSGNPDEVDTLPEYIGGIDNARKYIGERVEYPVSAIENDIEGTIVVTFDIERDGSVTDIKIDRGLGYGLDEEVIRVMTRMPKWIPAKLNGKNVQYKMRLPLSFKLS